MPAKLLKSLKSSSLLFPGVLLFITILISILNYTPGTFLTGWDTLHPELDFPLNFSRLLNGVWRIEQGFGAVAGHSHMADLPRVFILWLLHFILPQNFLRYSYIFLCLILGPLGFYYLALKLFSRKILAFLASLLYLLNLSTVQQFYVPFEMFPTQWALLPWIVFFSLQYLQKPSRRLLFLFSLFTLLSTPQAYAAHLWYPFFGAFLLFLILHTYLNKTNIKLPLKLIVLTLLINSFWLLPNLYFIKTSSWIPQQNSQNRLHSQEFLLKNRETGNLIDTALAKGFYFNWDSFNFSAKKSQNLMSEWNLHLQNADVLFIGFAIFSLSLFGLYLSIRHRHSTLLAFAPFFIIPFILLGNQLPLFRQFFDLLLKVKILEETLRFIFTKVSILYIFGLVPFFVYGLSSLISSLSSKKQNLAYILVGLSFVIFAYPVFEGKLISPVVKNSLPASYQQFWQFMSQKPQGSTLALPLHEPSGWTYYDWGYQGSGLIWFGLKQPITDRDSDRWSIQNEESYREFYYSLYANDPERFIKTLEKYHIRYLLWDQNVTTTSPKNQDQITFKHEINRNLEKLQSENKLMQIANFDQLFVYEINQTGSLVELQTSPPEISPSYHWGYYDSQYENQDYYTQSQTKNNYFPFRNLLDNYNKIDQDKAIVSLATDSARLTLAGTTFILDTPTVLGPDELTKYTEGPLLVFVKNGAVTVSSPKETHGTSYPFPDLPHYSGYILGIKSLYQSGLSLRLCLKNTYTNLCALQDELSKHQKPSWDYFLIPPGDTNYGYNLELNAVSYAASLSQSQLYQVFIVPLPYQLLSQIVENPQTNLQTESFPAKYESLNSNNSLVKVTLNDAKPGTHLNFFQSYSPHWLAFYIKNTRPVFLNQVLINNWANGWQLPSNFTGTVYILFWPQLLEYFGFVLLICSFVYILVKKHP